MGNKVVTENAMNKFIDGLHQYLRDAFRPVATRLNDVEARVKQLEAEAEQKAYKGVFTEGETYRKHNSVTHDGSLWIAVADKTTAPPPGNGWRMAVRKGRDARN